jgi:hypothetical protein
VNVSKSIEKALADCMIAGGTAGAISSDDYFFNRFHDSDHEHEASFPQVEIIAAPDVPDGQEVDKVSPLRRVVVGVYLYTNTPDDRSHAVLSELYEKVRSALDEANNDLTAWSGTYLPANWYANCVLVQDSQEPYFDEDIQIIGLSVLVEVCVS